jgi:hypothetical protein
MYRARFAECLRAHTALLGAYLTVPDEPALIDALVDLARELAREVAADTWRERATD